MSDPSTTVSLNVFNALSASVGTLTEMMSEISARLAPTTNATASAAPVVTPATEFIPPVPSVLVTNGASLAPVSLRARFPDVEAAVLVSIITHEFRAANLHKLDPTNRDKDTAYTFNGTTNQFEVSHRAAKEYKTAFSVLVPLNHYFSILGFHLPKTDTVPFVFHQYMAHLIELVAIYEWSAVYDYHSVFFNRRRAEMSAGNYSGWGAPASDLLDKHVYGHRKPTPAKSSRTPGAGRSPSNPSEVCRKFNDGKCLTTPCPWGRPHTCSTCGKADHGRHSHKD